MSLGSKLDSLRNILQVYDNWLGILRVYFLGGETSASLHDLRGGRLLVRVSKDNVKRVILLGSILAKFQDRYEVRNDEIRCNVPYFNIVNTLRPNFTTEELEFLLPFSLLSKYVTRIVRFDDNHYLVTDIDSVNWIVRRASHIKSLWADVSFGPLLSYYAEPQEYECFLNALHGGGTFVDVGANMGGYSVRACKIGAEVIAVEPDPDNYHVLKLNLEFNQCTNAHVLNIAAGSKEEVRQLYGDEKRGRGDSAGYTLKQRMGRREVRCSVQVKPLDAAIPPLLGDEWVDLLKVDVEGFEVEVIKGALDLLKRTRHVIVEVLPNTNTRLLEVLNLIRPLRFELINKISHGAMCNLFLRKSM